MEGQYPPPNVEDFIEEFAGESPSEETEEALRSVHERYQPTDFVKWDIEASKYFFVELVEEMDDFVRTEYRRDAEFRANVFLDQIGDLARHISHDPDLNPPTRPLDVPEEDAYADAIWQLLALMKIRGVELSTVLSLSSDRLEDREGYLQQSDEELTGMVAYAGNHREVLYNLDKVLVLREFTASSVVDVTVDDYECILTEIGGMSSHAATVARERKIPCVVGIPGVVGKAEEGGNVLVDFDSGKVEFQ